MDGRVIGRELNTSQYLQGKMTRLILALFLYEKQANSESRSNTSLIFWLTKRVHFDNRLVHY